MNVYEASLSRLNYVFDHFDKISLSFSGGKDSGVMLHLAAKVARERNRKFTVMILDLEAQYQMTADYTEKMVKQYEDVIETLHWTCIPFSLDNSLSQLEPYWICWEPGKDWIREVPKLANTSTSVFPFYHYPMEFEEFIEAYGKWHGGCILVGIRADESLNRRTAVTNFEKSMFQGKVWTTQKDGYVSAYPIADWKTSDLWKFNSMGYEYNPIYDLMEMAGVPRGHQRLCHFVGHQQKQGAYLINILEPDTWSKLVKRLAGVGQVHSLGDKLNIEKPPNMTWKEYVMFILMTIPPHVARHYKAKIATYMKWYEKQGVELEDEGPTKEGDGPPNWKRIAKMLLRNNFWATSIGFSPTKTKPYGEYLKRKDKLIAEFNWDK